MSKKLKRTQTSYADFIKSFEYECEQRRKTINRLLGCEEQEWEKQLFLARLGGANDRVIKQAIEFVHDIMRIEEETGLSEEEVLEKLKGPINAQSQHRGEGTAAG